MIKARCIGCGAWFKVDPEKPVPKLCPDCKEYEANGKGFPFRGSRMPRRATKPKRRV